MHFSDQSEHPKPGATQPRLVGWKDIAAYLGKSERTVKRWGSGRNLPVHRVPGGASASVYAYPAELDQWLEAGDSSEPEAPDVARNPDSSEDGKTGASRSTGSADATVPQLGAPSARFRIRWQWSVAALILLAIALAFSVARFSRPGESAASSPHSTPEKKEAQQDSSQAPEASAQEKDLARDFYLKGRYEWNQRTPESLNRALDLFTQAIVHDPGSARAYAGLAETYDLLFQYSAKAESDVFPRAMVAAKKAVALDDSLPEAHRALAFAEMYGTWDFAAAEKEFRRAIELGPNDPQAHRWYANAFAVPGRFPESLREINRAQELDPSSNATLADKGYMLYNAGHTQDGIELLKEVESSAPGFLSAHNYMMVIALDRKDYSTYLAEGEKTAEILQDPVLADILAAARAGFEKDGGRGLMDRLYAKQKEYALQGKVEATMLAKTCALMGRRKEAIDLLETAYRRHEANVLSCLSHPDLLTLKADPGYAALVKKINFPMHPSPVSPDDLAAMEKQPQ